METIPSDVNLNTKIPEEVTQSVHNGGITKGLVGGKDGGGGGGGSDITDVRLSEEGITIAKEVTKDIPNGEVTNMLVDGKDDIGGKGGGGGGGKSEIEKVGVLMTDVRRLSEERITREKELPESMQNGELSKILVGGEAKGGGGGKDGEGVGRSEIGKVLLTNVRPSEEGITTEEEEVPKHIPNGEVTNMLVVGKDEGGGRGGKGGERGGGVSEKVKVGVSITDVSLLDEGMAREKQLSEGSPMPNREVTKMLVGGEEEGEGRGGKGVGRGGGGEVGGRSEIEHVEASITDVCLSEKGMSTEEKRRCHEQESHTEEIAEGEVVTHTTPILSSSECYSCSAKENGLPGDNCSHKSTHSKSKSKCCSSPTFNPFCRQMANVVVACLAGLSVGTIHAYPAVALPRWKEVGFVLSTAQTTWFASMPMIVSVMVCWCSGIVVESLGNRKCLFLGVPFLAVSWIVIALAESFWTLILGRLLQGLIASLYMVIITVYPAEVSVVRWRGIMTGISEAMVMLGAFLTYLAGLVLQPSPVAIIMAVGLIPMSVCYYFLRDSPLWLARQDMDEEAAVTLRCMRGPTADISLELEQIKISVATERIQKPSATEQLILLRKRIYLKPLMLSIFVLLFKELTGQYAVMAYTVEIFKLAGSSLDPYWCAVVMGGARFLPCFASWALIERLPRRLLICSCMTVAASALATLGAFLWFWTKKENGVPPSMGWVPLACLLVFTLVFGAGVGPTCWTLVAELLPSQVRNVGAGIINTSFSLFLFLVGLTFPFMVELIGIGLVFVTYSACCMVGVIFVIVCLPETKGRSFSEIQRALKGDKPDSSNAI